MTEQEIRIEKIRKEMRTNDVDVCLITSNVNLLYVTGQIVMGYLYIPVNGDPVLFLKRPEGIENKNTIYIRKPEQIIDEIKRLKISPPHRLMLEEDIMPHSEWRRIKSIFSNCEIINGTPSLKKVRSLKTEAEIELLRESGKKHAAVYRTIPSLFRKGMTDLEFSIEIERELRLAGSLGIFRISGQSMEIFMGSLLAGKNASEPSPYDFALGGKGLHPSIPIGANNTKLVKGLSIMVDMGGNFNGYMTDMTRTYSIGKLPEKAYDAHKVAIEIQDSITHMAKPGIICEDLYKKAISIAEAHGLDHCFMGSKQQARFIGHGVGIEVNEQPVLGIRSHMELEKNMVFAIEPKFIVDEIGAVGIENTFIVKENCVEKLTLLDENIIDLETGYPAMN